MLVMKSCFFCKISTPEFSGSIESSLYKMKSLNVCQFNYKDNMRYLDLFERELALLVALQGTSSKKGVQATVS